MFVCCLFAAGHCDKKPLSLIATTGTSLAGPSKIRTRSKLKLGKVWRKEFVLEQPDMHATYLRLFNAVDQYNRLATGPSCIMDVWRTKDVWDRIFAVTLSFMVVNAYLAYIKHGPLGKRDMTRQEWRWALSQLLLQDSQDELRLPEAPGIEQHMYMKSQCPQRRACFMCGRLQMYVCACGMPCCTPFERPCYLCHTEEVKAGLHPQRLLHKTKLKNKMLDEAIAAMGQKE